MEWGLPSREIDRRICGLVDRARGAYGLVEGGDGAMACRRLGLHLTNGPLPADTDGLLSGDHIILNDRVTWGPRREFTVFHEITHHLLDEDGELIEYLTDTYRTDATSYRRELERICNVGAAEFLMPRARVYEAIAEEGFSIGLVERTAKRHGVSVVAAAQQLALCAPRDSYVILAVDAAAASVPNPGIGLCIEYVFASPDTRYPLKRFRELESDHLLVVAWERQRRVSGPAYIPFSSGNRKDCYGEAQPLHSRVVGFLGNHRPHGKGQLALPLFN